MRLTGGAIHLILPKQNPRFYFTFIVTLDDENTVFSGKLLNISGSSYSDEFSSDTLPEPISMFIAAFPPPFSKTVSSSVNVCETPQQSTFTLPEPISVLIVPFVSDGI